MSGERNRGLRRGLILCAALLAGLLGYLCLPPYEQPETVLDESIASIGGPFELLGTDGDAFGSAELRGRPFAIFFGFTHCPDVCPTTLSRLASLRQEMGEGGDAFDIVFVTVDPARDTPGDMARYLSLFHTPIIGLTGSEAQIEAVKEEFGIYAEQVPLGNGAYTVDHTATVFLMDEEGNFFSALDVHDRNEDAIARLRRLIDG
ncbi:SCO family protein [Parasphingopyxis marina]|uniref:SCO family protein n=1 Tax=Parasphingopyxis marina TaxID=2761622 RepID=A0A842HWA7_9SPHN|nr:SCO family protein [Parasphingopyxis marina]MBC2776641.1 SCO family protein [Parasphingopyxis marina]